MSRTPWVGRIGFVLVSLIPFLSCSSGSEDAGPSGGGKGYNKGGSGGGKASDASTGGTFSPMDATVIDMGKSKDGPQFDPDAYWANDPPPPQCLDSGVTIPVPGGTPECPDDKNREGCQCPKVGEKAPCWPGFRKNRNRGICHDGTTTCILRGENVAVWGPCEGYQLPDPKATSGKAACLCFSMGQWKISNLSPCFGDNGGGPGSMGAVSTIFDGTQGQCPPTSGTSFQKPAQNWSANTLKVDCAGHFKLCYTLKAGTASAPLPTDCTLAKVCVEADYPTANMEQAFPDLPSWLAAAAEEITCAKQFASSGGYGEMSVLGESVECDEIDDGKGGERVFNRVQYCPLSCNQNPSAPECKNCQSGGSGQFGN